MSSILELTQQADNISADREENYLALAKTLSLDESAATAAEVADILRDSAHSALELNQLVAALRNRAEIRQRISTIPQLRDRQRELRHKIEIENQLLETSIRTHGEKTAPIQRELFELEKALAASSTWENELMGNCPDRSLQQRRKKLEAERPMLTAQVHKFENELGQIDIAISQEQHSEKLQNARKRVEVSLKSAREVSAKNWREAEEISHRQIEF